MEVVVEEVDGKADEDAADDDVDACMECGVEAAAGTVGEDHKDLVKQKGADGYAEGKDDGLEDVLGEEFLGPQDDGGVDPEKEGHGVGEAKEESVDDVSEVGPAGTGDVWGVGFVGGRDAFAAVDDVVDAEDE